LIKKEATMSNLEVERLPAAFKAEIAALYASAMLSGVIPDGRRAHVLGAVARLKAKYGAKIVNLRRSYPAEIVDAAERAIVAIENEHAATLA
jgi:hypothetical protein